MLPVEAASTSISAWPRRSRRLEDLEQIPDPRPGYMSLADEPAWSLFC